MHIQPKRSRRGFTLVEIMIVVSIIALLAAIAVPSYIRARKRSQATRILEDLRVVDQALDQYSIDTSRLAGFNPAFADMKNYLKTGSLLYTSGTDLFGDSYGPFTVDSIPAVPVSAFNALSDVTDSAFWAPFATP
jgi:prepilin-type N-terminal cleavage/methylation domain-containing protein